MSNSLKHILYDLARAKVEAGISQNQSRLLDLRESLQAESKSTAGDKHETGRAMLHLEQEKVQVQLAKNKEMLAVFDRVSGSESKEKVEFGALVICDQICFYILTGIGKILHENQVCYFVSMQSEIAQVFKGKKAGEMVSFKGKTFRIQEVL